MPATHISVSNFLPTALLHTLKTTEAVFCGSLPAW